MTLQPLASVLILYLTPEQNGGGPLTTRPLAAHTRLPLGRLVLRRCVAAGALPDGARAARAGRARDGVLRGGGGAGAVEGGLLPAGAGGLLGWRELADLSTGYSDMLRGMEAGRSGSALKLGVGSRLTADAGVLALAAAGGGSHDCGWVGVTCRETVWFLCADVRAESCNLYGTVLRVCCCRRERKTRDGGRLLYTRCVIPPAKQHHRPSAGLHRADPTEPSKTGSSPPGGPSVSPSPQGCCADATGLVSHTSQSDGGYFQASRGLRTMGNGRGVSGRHARISGVALWFLCLDHDGIYQPWGFGLGPSREFYGHSTCSFCHAPREKVLSLRLR